MDNKSNFMDYPASKIHIKNDLVLSIFLIKLLWNFFFKSKLKFLTNAWGKIQLYAESTSKIS